MLIYSHSAPDKLAPIAINKEFIQDSTDFCDLVDDPDIGIDVDIAIEYRAATTGDPDAIRRFLSTIQLSGYALDAHTLDHYVTRARNNPLFRPYIREAERIDFDFRDCLNSPCNYFAPTSNNIGSLADISSSLNYNTQPTISLTAIPAAFSMSMATLGKIPKSLQESFGELTQLTTDIFKNVMNIFNDDSEKVKEQEDAINSGSSYRSTSISDVYTSDYRHYMDVSTSAADLLGDIANTMGNCFRLYQYQHRYNPFDYNMNQQTANKSGILHKYGTSFTSLGYNGINLSHQRGYGTSNNSSALSPTPFAGRDSQLQGTLNGQTVKLYVTVFGGYYDQSNKALYRDASDKYNSAKGYEYFQNTQNGIGHRGGAYIFTPSLERTLINKVNQGFKYPSKQADPATGQFNRGFATDKTTLYNYFNLVAENVSRTQINQAVAQGTLKARINWNNKSFEIPVIDTKGPSSKIVSGTSYRVIDITADAAVDLWGLSLSESSSESGTIDTDVVETITNYISYKGASSSVAEVQFIIPGVFEPKLQSKRSSGSRGSIGGYSNGEIPSSALLPIGEGHKLYGTAAEAYLKMKAAAQADGIVLSVTDSYRSYDAQVDVAKRKGLYKDGGLAAVPGTSNHGLGKAVDLNNGTSSWPSTFKWLKQNAATYSFFNIPREPWHWEYRGP